MDNQQIKKNETARIVSNILIKQAIVTIIVSIVITIILVIIIRIMGMTPATITLKMQQNKEFLDTVQVINFLITLTVFCLSYIGIRWGCKNVSKKTYLEPKDYSKIGYWVALFPIVLSMINPGASTGIAIIFGILITPWIIKKWLTKFQVQFQNRQ